MAAAGEAVTVTISVSGGKKQATYSFSGDDGSNWGNGNFAIANKSGSAVRRPCRIPAQP